MPLNLFMKFEVEVESYLQLWSRVIRDLALSLVSWGKASSRDFQTSFAVERPMIR